MATYTDILRALEVEAPGLRFLSPSPVHLLVTNETMMEVAAGFTMHDAPDDLSDAAFERLFRRFLACYGQSTPVSKACVLYDSNGRATNARGLLLYWRTESASLYGVDCVSAAHLPSDSYVP